MGAQLGLWLSFALIGFGLILIVEGLVYAIAPEAMKKLLLRMVEVPASALRTGGLIAAVVGFALLWAVQTFPQCFPSIRSHNCHCMGACCPKAAGRAPHCEHDCPPYLWMAAIYCPISPNSLVRFP